MKNLLKTQTATNSCCSRHFSFVLLRSSPCLAEVPNHVSHTLDTAWQQVLFAGRRAAHSSLWSGTELPLENHVQPRAGRQIF